MSKKQKRQVSQGASPAPTSTAAPVFKRTISTGPAEFNPDYSPVVKDLKRIGILAGSFFVILIALSFILK